MLFVINVFLSGHSVYSDVCSHQEDWSLIFCSSECYLPLWCQRPRCWRLHFVVSLRTHQREQISDRHLYWGWLGFFFFFNLLSYDMGQMLLPIMKSVPWLLGKAVTSRLHERVCCFSWSCVFLVFVMVISLCLCRLHHTIHAYSKGLHQSERRRVLIGQWRTFSFLWRCPPLLSLLTRHYLVTEASWTCSLLCDGSSSALHIGHSDWLVLIKL